MEDSFRVRLDRAFGSLPIPSSSSLWSLTHDEINPKPTTNPTHQPEPEPEPESKPYSWSGAATSSSSSRFQNKLEKDLEDLDDDDDDDEDDNEPRGPSKPDDYDDEQWQIRSGIGRDCTLDFEVLFSNPFSLFPIKIDFVLLYGVVEFHQLTLYRIQIPA